jgi:ubiquinone/menaquinone biosynthesis C-methylase UbiE
VKTANAMLRIRCTSVLSRKNTPATTRPSRVVAADFSPAVLAQARGRGWDAEFVLMDICRNASADRQFDVVFCFHSFPHFRDQKAALRQIARHLKAGGQLLVVHLVGSEQLNEFHH